MKRSFVIALVLFTGLAFGGAGCANTYLASKRSGPLLERPRSFALAVTVAGGLQPTPTQWTLIQSSFARELAARGWVLVTDVDLADHIVRVHFTPDLNDPENLGRAAVLGVRANPRTMVARSGIGPYPSSTGFSSFSSSSWMSSGRYSAGYYGYNDFINDGVSYYAPNPPSSRPPPYRRPPGQHDDCPPGLFIRPLPTRGDVAANPINDHPRPPPRDLGRFRSDRVAYAGIPSVAFDSRAAWSSAGSRSERGYSRSDSSYARAESAAMRGSSYSALPRAQPIYSHQDSSSSRYEPPVRNDPPPSAAYSTPEPSYSAPPPPSVTYSAPSYSPPADSPAPASETPQN